MLENKVIHNRKSLYIRSLVLFLFLLLLGSSVYFWNRGEKLAKELKTIKVELNALKTFEESRMNGTNAYETVENVEISDKTVTGGLSDGIYLAYLEEIPFKKITYDFRTTFDKFYASKDGISISIEKIKNNSPYLVLYPSEFLGVRSIENLAYPIAMSNELDSELYNTTINNIPFSKKYTYNQSGGSIGLKYETVLPDQTGEYLYYLVISTWENILDLSDKDFNYARNNPKEWFSKHPSENFEKLNLFVTSISKKR